MTKLHRTIVRAVVATAVSVISVAAPAGVVFADPAGPTDYRSEVIGIDPPTPEIALDVLGGDSFLQLTVRSGTEALVIGYRGEPYLWFRPDGTIWENRLSPTTYLNAERYGTEAPDFADPDADPDWQEVGTGGRWSWHDHRAHLMQPVPPFGTGPGDRILESVVPLVVDGTEVDVTVISTWQPEPSTVPLWVGGLAGLLVGVVAVAAVVLVVRRRPGVPPTVVTAVVAIVPAAVGVVAGAWQYGSLPAETGPRLTWWLLPTVAAVAALCALVPFVRRDRTIAPVLVALAGALLIGWAWMRLDGVTAAIVPTDAPNWFDRGSTVGVLVAGVSIATLAVRELIRPTRRPDQRDHN